MPEAAVTVESDLGREALMDLIMAQVILLRQKIIELQESQLHRYNYREYQGVLGRLAVRLKLPEEPITFGYSKHNDFGSMPTAVTAWTEPLIVEPTGEADETAAGWVIQLEGFAPGCFITRTSLPAHTHTGADYSNGDVTVYRAVQDSETGEFTNELRYKISPETGHIYCKENGILSLPEISRNVYNDPLNHDATGLTKKGTQALSDFITDHYSPDAVKAGEILKIVQGCLAELA